MPSKPYIPGVRAKGKPKHDHGSTAEKRMAKRLGAILTPASGAAHHGAKGDMTLPDFRLENKATIKDSYRLTYASLCKIAQEASEQNEQPAFAVQFVSPNGKPRSTGSWVLLPDYVFKELLK